MRRIVTVGGIALAFLVGGRLLAADSNKGTEVQLDGLKSKVPEGWKEQEVNSKFRVAHFLVPKAGDDPRDAEMIVFYFGPGGGGGVAENVKRWKGMFIPPEGKEIDDVSKKQEMKVGEVAVTYVDIRGTYLHKERPFDPDAKAEKRPDYRMLAIVFESPKGPYFIRLVGPARTVEKHKKGFDDFLKGFAP